MNQLRPIILAALVSLSAATPACSLEEVLPGSDEDLSQLTAYRAEMKMVSSPYRSDLAPNPQIEVWIDPAAATSYQRIRPDQKGANVALPEGTLIVREVLGADGKITKLTVMGKGAAGTNPALGDWWFAVTTPTGVPLEENGAPLSGKLTQCYSCHDQRGAADDYLFGVAVAAKRPVTL